MYMVLLLCGGVDVKEYKGDNKSVEITGKVTDKMFKNNAYCLHIKCKGKNKNSNKYIIYLKNQNAFDFKIGQTVKLKGRYQNFSRPENEGQFDSRKYYRIRGYEASIKGATVIHSGKRYSYIKERLFLIKERTKKVYAAYMDESEASTLSAMVLGDKTGLDADVKDLYQAAGISHVLSLSGLHIAAVGMCLFTILRYSGLGLFGASMISSAVMTMYGLMTGFSTSTIRALIMFILAVIAKAIGRTYDLMSGMCLASILIIVENPYYIFDSGFLLSVLSVSGISLIYPILLDITDFFKKEKGAIYEKTRKSICISLSTNLATLPVVFNTFFKISRYSIFINIIVVPLMSIILGIGIIVLIIANTVIKLKPFRVITRGLLFTAQKIIMLYSFLCGNVSRLAGNYWIVGKGESWQNVVYIILMSGVVLGYWSYVNRVRSNDKNKDELRKKMKIRETALIVISVFVLAFRIKPELSVNALSVGQGACNVIYGRDIPTIMVDGGSSDVKDVYKYRIRPFLLSNGISEIDYLFVTHPDMDHISGVKELLSDELKEVNVKHQFVSVEDADSDNPEFVHIISKGDRIENGSITIECLSPENEGESKGGDNLRAVSSGVKLLDTDIEANQQKSGRGKQAESLNDMSLVLKVTYKTDKKHFTMLYTGDISSSVEQSLVGETQIIDKLKNIDYLSVPHHGSKYSSSEQFVNTVNPKVSVISAGKNNSYGHPHKETLERLESVATSIYRTDELGQITCSCKRNGPFTVRSVIRHK
jgi:competence protein ComEC